MTPITGPKTVLTKITLNDVDSVNDIHNNS